MIFFCEDCGKKNNLIPAQFKDGRAVFRCEACNYFNSYIFKMPEKKYSKKIEQLLEEINACSEIIGSFLFHEKAGVLKNDMPAILENTALEILGKTLISTYRTSYCQYPDINGMTMVISNKNMITKMIDTHLMIVIASKGLSLSKNILDTLARMASEGIVEKSDA